MISWMGLMNVGMETGCEDNGSVCVCTRVRGRFSTPRSSSFAGAARPEGKQLDATQPALQICMVAMCNSASYPVPQALLADRSSFLMSLSTQSDEFWLFRVAGAKPSRHL